jgi:hypothetical protein
LLPPSKVIIARDDKETAKRFHLAPHTLKRLKQNTTTRAANVFLGAAFGACGKSLVCSVCSALFVLENYDARAKFVRRMAERLREEGRADALRFQEWSRDVDRRASSIDAAHALRSFRGHDGTENKEARQRQAAQLRKISSLRADVYQNRPIARHARRSAAHRLHQRTFDVAGSSACLSNH